MAMAKRPSSRTNRTGTSGKGPSQRQLRAGELIRHALVEMFQRDDLRDPALDGVSVTISEVRPTPDLRQATVYCMPLGASQRGHTDEDEAIIASLNENAPRLRGLLGKKIAMKYTPALIFRKDESFDEAGRIDALLASPEVARDLSSADHDDDL